MINAKETATFRITIPSLSDKRGQVFATAARGEKRFKKQ